MPTLELAPDQTLGLLAERIEAELGLHFSAAKRRELDGALRRMAAAKGFAGSDDCARWLLAGAWDEAKTALCARFLTIGETYFFREPRALDLLCDYVRARAPGGAALRIWSAGCCTGEEPYSIAMTLRDRVPQLAPAQATILATDLNETFLDFARAGVYRQWSFRRTSGAARTAHFAALADGRLRIAPELRAQVRFAQLNLALPCYPSAATQTQGMDIIFCRNVLMYFARPLMKQVIARFRACLVDGGWLVVNPSEASSELFEGFAPVYFPDAVYFRKTDARPAATPVRAAAPVPPRAAHPPCAERRRAPAKAPAVPLPRAARASAPAHAHEDEQAGALARAQAFVRAGQPDAALQCLRRASETGPLAAELYQAAAQIAIEQRDWPLARQNLKRLIYLQPDSALAHYLSGVAEDAQDRRASALRLFQACAALLAPARAEDVVPGSDGWLAGSLRESVKARLERAR